MRVILRADVGEKKIRVRVCVFVLLASCTFHAWGQKKKKTPLSYHIACVTGTTVCIMSSVVRPPAFNF